MNNFDANGFAVRDTRAKVYNYNRENHEYTGSSYEHVVEGSGIPAFSTLIEALPDKDGFTQTFDEDNKKWNYVEDHRYEDVYNIHTKQREDIRYIGALKDEHTTLEPPSHEHELIDGEWIITEEKLEELEAMQKQQRINELEAEKSQLSTDMNMHLLLDEKEEAKVCAERIKEINAEIEALKA